MILCKGARKSEHPKGKVPRTLEVFNDILTSISSSNWENCCFLETFLGGPSSSSRSKFAAKADVSLSERRLRPLSDITAATRASDGLRDLPEVREGEVVRGAVVTLRLGFQRTILVIQCSNDVNLCFGFIGVIGNDELTWKFFSVLLFW